MELSQKPPKMKLQSIPKVKKGEPNLSCSCRNIKNSWSAETPTLAHLSLKKPWNSVAVFLIRSVRWPARSALKEKHRTHGCKALCAQRCVTAMQQQAALLTERAMENPFIYSLACGFISASSTEHERERI